MDQNPLAHKIMGCYSEALKLCPCLLLRSKAQKRQYRVADDPESFEDLDGHEGFWQVFSEFSAGLKNALVSDNLAGIGRQEQTTAAGQAGAIVGDTLATLQGAGEATTGGTLVAAGAAACSTGAGCVVGAPAIGVGSLAAVHGATTAAEGTGHLLVHRIEDRRWSERD